MSRRRLMSSALAVTALGAVSLGMATSQAPAAASPHVSLDAIATTNDVTGEVTANGSVAMEDGTPVRLQTYDAASHVWVDVADGKVRDGKVSIKAQRPGSISQYRLTTSASDRYTAGASAATTLASYVWRSAFVKPIRGVDSNGSESVAISPASVDGTPSHVRLRVLTTDNNNNSAVMISPDITGCDQVRTTTKNTVPASTTDSGSTTLFLTANNTNRLATFNLPRWAAAPYSVSAYLTGVSSLTFGATPAPGSNPIIDLTSTVELHCAS
ncbi:hypothetical protein [Kribbella sp. NPDC004536]|uniref:hypothetical protein n=1 Tax=Kribbella sp. NPDC004536 TaxID=3364106 RepID=UPI0036A41002